MTTKNTLNTDLEEDGFILLRNVLTTDEVSSLRLIIKNHFANYGLRMLGGLSQPNAAVLLSELDWIFSHPKIINALKSLCPDQKLMFTSHCDIHSGIIAGWHKDDGTTTSDKNNFGYIGCLTTPVKVQKQPT